MGGGRKGDFDIATKLDGNQGKIVVNALDKESNYLNFLELEASIVRPGGLGVERITMTQVGPGRYEAVFAVEQTGQFISNITLR